MSQLATHEMDQNIISSSSDKIDEDGETTTKEHVGNDNLWQSAKDALMDIGESGPSHTNLNRMKNNGIVKAEISQIENNEPVKSKQRNASLTASSSSLSLSSVKGMAYEGKNNERIRIKHSTHSSSQLASEPVDAQITNLSLNRIEVSNYSEQTIRRMSLKKLNNGSSEINGSYNSMEDLPMDLNYNSDLTQNEWNTSSTFNDNSTSSYDYVQGNNEDPEVIAGNTQARSRSTTLTSLNLTQITVNKSRSRSVFQNILPSERNSTESTKLSTTPTSSCLFSSWCWKEGGLRKSWKRRYFKLHDKYITYGKTSQTILSKIPINIITSITPYHHSNAPVKYREHGWRMTVKKGRHFREYFIVAENTTEFQIWVNLIQKLSLDLQNQNVLDSLKSVVSELNIQQLLLFINDGVQIESLREKVNVLIQKLPLKDRSLGFTTYKQSISGAELLIAIQEVYTCSTLHECICIGSSLLQNGVIDSMTGMGRSEIVDDRNTLYRLTSSDTRIESPTSQATNSLGSPEVRNETKDSDTLSLSAKNEPKYKDNSDIRSEKSKFSTSNTLISQSRVKSGSTLSNSDMSKKEKIRSNIGAISKAMVLFSENTSRLEFLNSEVASKFYTSEVRQQKIENRYKVAISQRVFIKERISEAMEFETVRLKKVKREKSKIELSTKANHDDILSIQEYYRSREMKFEENIYRIKKLQQQFNDLNYRFNIIEKEVALRVKKENEPKFFQMIRSENNDWNNIEYEESEVPIPNQHTVIPQIKVKGRKKKQTDKLTSPQNDTRNMRGELSHFTPIGGNVSVSTLNIDSQVLLRDETNFTVDTMKEIESERLRRLMDLEVDMEGLTELYHDLRSIIKENQGNINTVEKNLYNINTSLEKGRENITAARELLPSSQFKQKIDKGINKSNTLFKWIL